MPNKTIFKKFEGDVWNGGIKGFDPYLSNIISVKGAAYTKNGEKLIQSRSGDYLYIFIILLNIVIPVLVNTLKTFLNLKFGFLQYRLLC